MKKVQDSALSMRARIAARARARCQASRVCRAVVIPIRKHAILYLALLVAGSAILVYLVHLMEYVISHPDALTLPNFSLMV